MQTAYQYSLYLEYRRLSSTTEADLSAQPQSGKNAVLGFVAVGQAGPSVLTTLKAGWAAAESHHVPIPKFNFMS